MTKPLIVEIPHALGRAGAKARLQEGIGTLTERFRGSVASVETGWAGDRLTFNVGAIGQTVTGTIDVEDDRVRVEVQLPWVLAILAQKASGLIRREGQLLLDKKVA